MCLSAECDLNGCEPDRLHFQSHLICYDTIDRLSATSRHSWRNISVLTLEQPIISGNIAAIGESPILTETLKFQRRRTRSNVRCVSGFRKFRWKSCIFLVSIILFDWKQLKASSFLCAGDWCGQGDGDFVAPHKQRPAQARSHLGRDGLGHKLHLLLASCKFACSYN